MIYFDGILGNADTKARLGKAIGTGTLPHAIMITGARGTGKRTLADSIAQALCCESGEARLPCGECVICKRIKRHEHTDVKYLTKSAGKATIGVEEVRLLREDMFLSPSECDKKVYIVEYADTLTPQSQNALLKVLEEPPRAVYIILIASSPDKMLSTIKSRVQLITMECFDKEMAVHHLRRLTSGKSDAELRAAVQGSGGSLGRALENLSEEKRSERAQINGTVNAFINALPQRVPYSALYSVMLDFPQKREELRQTLEVILDALRDLLALRLNDECAELLFFDSAEAIDSSLRTVSARRLCYMCDTVLGAIEDLDRNVITSTLITDLSVRIKKTK